MDKDTRCIQAHTHDTPPGETRHSTLFFFFAKKYKFMSRLTFRRCFVADYHPPSQCLRERRDLTGVALKVLVVRHPLDELNRSKILTRALLCSRVLDNVAWVALAVEPVASRAQARHSLQRRRLGGKALGVHTEDAPPSPTNPPIHTHTRCAAAPPRSVAVVQRLVLC